MVQPVLAPMRSCRRVISSRDVARWKRRPCWKAPPGWWRRLRPSHYDLQALLRAEIERLSGRRVDAAKRLAARIDGTAPLLLHAGIATAQADS